MTATAQIFDIGLFKQKALQWASAFDVAVCLNSNNFDDDYANIELMIAVGVNDEIKCQAGAAFAALNNFRQKHRGWVLGFMAYDLKNETETLSSNNTDHLGFPDLYFFAPVHLIVFKNSECQIISPNQDFVLNSIHQQTITASDDTPAVNIKSRIHKEEYIQTVMAIQQHIIRGDIYETNFCQEFYAENVDIKPIAVYNKLQQISPSPFAAFFKLHSRYIISASPERFVAKRGNQLISQPIKGTAKRSADQAEDERLKHSLKQNTKELQENVMIVDLVRNDLTRSAKAGTVKVKELFGLYSFEQVHQMISTIVCTKDERLSDVEAIKNLFPMGSMTGAPKVNAMRLMEKYESTKRGVYSGAIGYFSPGGDFDFNVVIRSILYNKANGYLSFQTGSAITHNADAAQEYEECLLKAKALMEVLGNTYKAEVKG